MTAYNREKYVAQAIESVLHDDWGRRHPDLFRTRIAFAGNPAVFAKATLGLLNDEAFYQNLQRAARRLVNKRFDWRILGKEINRIIDEVARNSSSVIPAGIAVY
jgi:glycosyltransferase involved in cell wall biosynthesis